MAKGNNKPKRAPSKRKITPAKVGVGIAVALIGAGGPIVASLINRGKPGGGNTTTATSNTGHATAITGDNAKVYNAAPGASQTIVESLNAKDTAAELHRLANEEAERDSELAKSYPLGFAIFGMTDTNVIIPFVNRWGRTIKANWSTAQVTMEKDTIKLTCPRMVFDNGELFTESGFILRRQIGSVAVFQINDIDICGTIAKTSKNGVVAVLGVRPAR